MKSFWRRLLLNRHTSIIFSTLTGQIFQWNLGISWKHKLERFNSSQAKRERERERERERQRDRQTDRQTDRRRQRERTSKKENREVAVGREQTARDKRPSERERRGRNKENCETCFSEETFFKKLGVWLIGLLSVFGFSNIYIAYYGSLSIMYKVSSRHSSGSTLSTFETLSWKERWDLQATRAHIAPHEKCGPDFLHVRHRVLPVRHRQTSVFSLTKQSCSALYLG